MTRTPQLRTPGDRDLSSTTVPFITAEEERDAGLAETWKITHQCNGKIDHMLENA